MHLFIYLSSARKKATAKITRQEYRQYYEKKMLKSQIGSIIIQQEGKNVKPNVHILFTLANSPILMIWNIILYSAESDKKCCSFVCCSENRVCLFRIAYQNVRPIQRVYSSYILINPWTYSILNRLQLLM
jgi:hypothetical protein